MTDSDDGARSASEIANQAIKDESKVVLPKRFYTSVEVKSSPGGYVVLLDTRTVRTPGKRELVVPSKSLCEAIATEWGEQTEFIDPRTMPLTKLANTAVDAVSDSREEVSNDIRAYAGTDVVCYRADHPRELVERQKEAWDPVLEWARDTLSAEFKTATGIVHVAQSEDALNAVAAALADRDEFAISALHVMTSTTGSALIALRCASEAMTPEEAWSTAHVDEDWQISMWGHDAEAARSRANAEMNFQAAARTLRLLSDG